MNINPASDVLIVKEITPSESTPAGIFLPPSHTEKDTLMKAVIVAAGPGKINAKGDIIPHDFVVDEIIVFEKRRALPVTYEGEKYIFINASEVFGTVEKVN
jgi:chaperonin GroES